MIYFWCTNLFFFVGNFFFPHVFPLLPDKKLDLNVLLVQLKCINDDYLKFGEAAGIDAETLQNIAGHVTQSEEGMVEVCDLWFHKCWADKVTPSWSGVAEILTRMGRKDWAKKIVKVYTTGTCDCHNIYMDQCTGLLSEDLDREIYLGLSKLWVFMIGHLR